MSDRGRGVGEAGMARLSALFTGQQGDVALTVERGHVKQAAGQRVALQGQEQQSPAKGQEQKKQGLARHDVFRA